MIDGLAEWLIKAAGHKYLRRIPTGNPKRKYNYVYARQSKHHDRDYHAGEKIKLTHDKQAGHYEVKSTHGDYVTLHHDETGHEVSVHRDKLSQMFRDEHHAKPGQAEKKAAIAHSASKTAQKTGKAFDHALAADLHNEAADAGAEHAALHRKLGTAHTRAAAVARSKAQHGKDRFVIKLKKPPKPGQFGNKGQAWDTLMESLRGELPQGHVIANQKYLEWRQRPARRKGPKPSPWKGGELDAVNEALDLRAPNRSERMRGVKDRRVTSLREGFERLTAGAKRWNDPKVKEVLRILREVPGLETIRVPESEIERAQKKEVDKEAEAYYRERQQAQGVDIGFDPDEGTAKPDFDDSFDFGFNVVEATKSMSGIDCIGEYLEKAGGHKYIERRGTPGHYTYVYESESTGMREMAPSRGASSVMAAMKSKAGHYRNAKKAARSADSAGDHALAAKRWGEAEVLATQIHAMARKVGHEENKWEELASDAKFWKERHEETLKALGDKAANIRKETLSSPGGATSAVRKVRGESVSSATVDRNKLARYINQATMTPRDLVSAYPGMGDSEAKALLDGLYVDGRVDRKPGAKVTMDTIFGTIRGKYREDIPAVGEVRSPEHRKTSLESAQGAKVFDDLTEDQQKVLAETVGEEAGKIQSYTVASDSLAEAGLIEADSGALTDKGHKLMGTRVTRYNEKGAKKSWDAIDELRKAVGLPSASADISPAKARQILHDGTVHGKPLTEQQRKFFGAIGGHLPAPGKKKTEKSMNAIEALEEFYKGHGATVAETTTSSPQKNLGDAGSLSGDNAAGAGAMPHGENKGDGGNMSSGAASGRPSQPGGGAESPEGHLSEDDVSVEEQMADKPEWDEQRRGSQMMIGRHRKSEVPAGTRLTPAVQAQSTAHERAVAISQLNKSTDIPFGAGNEPNRPEGTEVIEKAQHQRYGDLIHMSNESDLRVERMQKSSDFYHGAPPSMDITGDLRKSKPCVGGGNHMMPAHLTKCDACGAGAAMGVRGPGITMQKSGKGLLRPYEPDLDLSKGLTIPDDE
jgi:hypothetical protein